MDEADVANDQHERWLQGRIEEFQHQLNQVGNAYEIGRCRNCNEQLDDGRPYCDKDCADDFEARLRAEKRRGRVAE